MSPTARGASVLMLFSVAVVALCTLCVANAEAFPPTPTVPIIVNVTGVVIDPITGSRRTLRSGEVMVNPYLPIVITIDVWAASVKEYALTTVNDAWLRTRTTADVDTMPNWSRGLDNCEPTVNSAWRVVDDGINLGSASATIVFRAVCVVIDPTAPIIARIPANVLPMHVGTVENLLGGAGNTLEGLGVLPGVALDSTPSANWLVGVNPASADVVVLNGQPRSRSPSASRTRSRSVSGSRTPSRTPSVSRTLSGSVSGTASPSFIPSLTCTVSGSPTPLPSVSTSTSPSPTSSHSPSFSTSRTNSVGTSRSASTSRVPGWAVPAVGSTFATYGTVPTSPSVVTERVSRTVTPQQDTVVMNMTRTRPGSSYDIFGAFLCVQAGTIVSTPSYGVAAVVSPSDVIVANFIGAPSVIDCPLSSSALHFYMSNPPAGSRVVTLRLSLDAGQLNTFGSYVAVVIYVDESQWFPVPVAAVVLKGYGAGIWQQRCTAVSLKPGVASSVNATDTTVTVNGIGSAYVIDEVLQGYDIIPTGQGESSSILYVFYRGPPGKLTQGMNPPRTRDFPVLTISNNEFGVPGKSLMEVAFDPGSAYPLSVLAPGCSDIIDRKYGNTVVQIMQQWEGTVNRDVGTIRPNGFLSLRVDADTFIDKVTGATWPPVKLVPLYMDLGTAGSLPTIYPVPAAALIYRQTSSSLSGASCTVVSLKLGAAVSVNVSDSSRPATAYLADKVIMSFDQLPVDANNSAISTGVYVFYRGVVGWVTNMPLPGKESIARASDDRATITENNMRTYPNVSAETVASFCARGVTGRLGSDARLAFKWQTFGSAVTSMGSFLSIRLTANSIDNNVRYSLDAGWPGPNVTWPVADLFPVYLRADRIGILTGRTPPVGLLPFYADIVAVSSSGANASYMSPLVVTYATFVGALIKNNSVVAPTFSQGALSAVTTVPVGSISSLRVMLYVGVGLRVNVSAVIGQASLQTAARLVQNSTGVTVRSTSAVILPYSAEARPFIRTFTAAAMPGVALVQFSWVSGSIPISFIRNTGLYVVIDLPALAFTDTSGSEAMSFPLNPCLPIYVDLADQLWV